MASKRALDHSSSSSTQSRWSYDVFLSFRGQDTRKNFTDHLYEALVQAGIRTFRDDDELPRGREISSELLKSIEESRISIVVFSRNYASSRWCLDELVKIIECKKTLGQLVLPIFYDVCPSDVRKQTGYFGEAFGRHEKRFVDEMEKVEVRRAALSEVANLSGWDLQNVANGDMGREIVREKYPKEPEKRSRLWFHEDVCYVLEKNKGTEAVEGVNLILPMLKKIQLSNKAFARMSKLRLLQINHVHLNGNFEHLFEELRWLCWHNCPLEYLPYNFHPEKLIILDMQFSKIKSLWKDGKHFRSLKILNLSNSKCLTKSPIFCALSMLEELLLESCTSLMKLHESIGLLDKLVYLNLEDCKNLRYLPSSIYKLKSVKHLNLIGCAKLEEFPEHLGHMESLTELLADGTAIKQLPFSIGLLKNLRSLSLKGCNRQFATKSGFSLISSGVLPRKNPDSISWLPSSVSGLCSLTKLDLSDCNLSEGNFPANFGSLSSLQTLNLGGNNFRSLPYGFNHLSKLESLYVNDCTSLQSISNLPPDVISIRAYGCASLEKISNLSKLKDLLIYFGSQSSRMVCIPSCKKDPHCFQGARIIPLDRRIPQYLCDMDGPNVNNFYAGSDLVISSLLHQMIGSSLISLEVPVVQGEDNYVSGFDVRVVFYRTEDKESCSMELDDYPYITITDKINGIDFTYIPTFFAIPESSGESSGAYVWNSQIGVGEYFGYRIKGGEKFEISITMPSPFRVKQWAMDVILVTRKPTPPTMD